MNKYQNALMKRVALLCPKAKPKFQNIKVTNDVAKIYQNDDLDISNYEIFAVSNKSIGNAISFVEWKIGDGLIKDTVKERTIADKSNILACVSPKFQFRDSSERPAKLIIHWVNDLADPVIINFEYIDASDEAFASKKAKEKKEKDASDISLQLTSGENIINTYYKKACNYVDSTIVTLESKIEIRYNVYERYPVEEKIVSADTLFVPFINLAHGTYIVTVKQQNKKGVVLAETSKEIKLIGPVYNARPVNINN